MPLQRAPRGLGQIHFPIGVCTRVHAEPAKASGTFATTLLIITEAELYSLRSLTCFAALKGLWQPARPWPVFGLRADSRPAGRGSELGDTARGGTVPPACTARPRGDVEQRLLYQPGGSGPRGRGVRRKEPAWVIARSGGSYGRRNLRSGLRASNGWCKESLLSVGWCKSVETSLTWHPKACPAYIPAVAHIHGLSFCPIIEIEGSFIAGFKEKYNSGCSEHMASWAKVLEDSCI